MRSSDAGPPEDQSDRAEPNRRTLEIVADGGWATHRPAAQLDGEEQRRADRRRRSFTRISMASAAIETGLSHVVLTEALALSSRVTSGCTNRTQRDAGDKGGQPVERGLRNGQDEEAHGTPPGSCAPRRLRAPGGCLTNYRPRFSTRPRRAEGRPGAAHLDPVHVRPAAREHRTAVSSLKRFSAGTRLRT